LSAGELNWVDAVPLQSLSSLSTDPSYTYVTSATAGIPDYLALNTVQPPFNDKLVRQAVYWALDRTQIVVCGIEAHACVSQTVHDLLDRGYTVHLPYDAISARAEHDLRAGWEKMIGSGAIPSSVEMVCLEWVRTAEAPEFKAIHRLIK
jgi:nicotinamidase-related amidase